MIYVYGLTDADEPDCLGMDDQPVALRTCGDVAAAYTTHAGRKIPVTPENVWRHEQVIERLMACATVLPARFGTSFDQEQTLDAILERNRERLRDGLVRLRGKVEMGVRVLWRPPDESPETPAPGASGRDYLTRRAIEQRRRDFISQKAARLAGAIHAELSPHASESHQRIRPAPDVLMSAAYLLPRQYAGQFAAMVRQTAARHPDLRILGTGPWPPYHFTPTLE